MEKPPVFSPFLKYNHNRISLSKHGSFKHYHTYNNPFVLIRMSVFNYAAYKVIQFIDLPEEVNQQLLSYFVHFADVTNIFKSWLSVRVDMIINSGKEKLKVQ